jgi:hypothetical protein
MKQKMAPFFWKWWQAKPDEVVIHSFYHFCPDEWEIIKTFDSKDAITI